MKTFLLINHDRIHLMNSQIKFVLSKLIIIIPDTINSKRKYKKNM